MEQDLTTIIHELSSHETELKTELEALTQKTMAISDQLNQIQTAIEALSGPKLSKQGRNESKAMRKPMPQAVIENIITTILREQKTVPVADLLRLVKSRLLTTGHSRLGLKSLLSKTLSSTKFNVDQAENVTLA